MNKLLMAAVGAAALTFAAAPAGAVVYIGLSTNGGGTITQVAVDPVSATVVNFAFNGWQVTANGDAFVFFPELLSSGALGVKNTSSTGTLDVFITRDNLDTTISPATFLSSFTINSLTAGTSVLHRTYVDDNNGKFATAPGGGITLVGSQAFTGVTGTTQIGSAPVTGAYSVTQRYSVTAGRGGAARSTIDMAVPAPEPASWAMMIAGFGLTGALMRLRRRQRLAPTLR
jgi:hypothetical protein